MDTHHLVEFKGDSGGGPSDVIIIDNISEERKQAVRDVTQMARFFENLPQVNGEKVLSYRFLKKGSLLIKCESADLATRIASSKNTFPNFFGKEIKIHAPRSQVKTQELALIVKGLDPKLTMEDFTRYNDGRFRAERFIKKDGTVMPIAKLS